LCCSSIVVDSGYLEYIAVVLLWIQVIWVVLQWCCCGFRSSGMCCISIAVDSGHLEYVCSSIAVDSGHLECVALVLWWIQVIWNVLQ